MRRRMLLQQARLPSEYQEVEYIQSDGDSWLNTLVRPSINIRTILDFQFVQFSGYNRLFGASWVADITYNVRTLASTSEAGGTIDWELGTYTRWYIDTDYDRHTIDFNKLEDNLHRAYYDDGLAATFNTPDFVNNEQYIYIFAHNTFGSEVAPGSAIAKMYSVEMYDGGTLIRSLVPCCRKSNNEIGMYDLVGGVFYTNQGTGTFTKGSDV